MTTGYALSKVRQRAAPITCKHWRIVSYAVKRRMLGFNPVLHTAKRKLIDTPPEIFGVNELRGLLGAAQRTEPSVLLMLAIGASESGKSKERTPANRSNFAESGRMASSL